MAVGAGNVSVVELVAQATGFNTTGKSIDDINQHLTQLLGTMGKVGKIDIYNKLLKDGDTATGKLKASMTVLDQFGNVYTVVSKKIGASGDQYKLVATEVKKSTNVLQDNLKVQKEAAKVIDQNAKAAEAGAKKWREALDSIGKRKAGQGDVSDINKQLGGFSGGFTNAGMLGIDRANKNLLDLLSKSNVKTPRLNQIFGATQKNDRSVLDGLSESEQKVSIALRRLSAAFDQASSAGQRTQNVLIGFRGMLRLLEVQQLHSVISNLSSYFEQASAKSTELTGQIALIQTISQSAKLSTDDWRDSLIRLSNAYGFDAIDVAKAGYEAISNQIAKGAAVTPFLAQSFEFARATASSAAQSVDLLSAALNGYGLGTESVQKVSAILFKTIDLGRVKASELANTLGNSTPIAHSLGISLEELMAGIATLTIQGIKSDTALTLMNNIMLKLMKPTAGMKELFQDWGVASGEAAIQAFGFVGVLEKLNMEYQKGGISKIADTIKDMRGIRGITALFANDFGENYKKTLGEITKGQEEFTNAVNITANAMQTKLAIEFQKLNNLFVGNVGFKKNELFLSAIQRIGGLDKAAKGFADAMMAVTGILVEVGIHFVNLNTLFDKANIGIGKLAPVILTAGTAYLIMYRAGNLVSAMLPLLNRGISATTSIANPASVAIGALGERMGLLNKNAFYGSLQFSAMAGKIGAIATVAIPALIGAYSYLQAVQQENERLALTGGSDFLASIADADIEASKKLQESTEKLSASLTGGLTKNLKELNLYWSVFQSRLNSLGEDALKSTSKFSIEDFENSLIGKNSVSKLQLLSERFNVLAGDIKNLFDVKNFEGADKALEKILDTTKLFKEEQRKVTEEVKKTTEAIRQSSEDKAFEYKLFNKSDSRKVKAFGQRSAVLQGEAEAALAAKDFEKADKLIERAIAAREKSMSISESAVSSQGFGKPKGLAQFQDLLETRIKIQEALGSTAKMGTRGDEMTDWARSMHNLVNQNLKSITAVETKLQEASNTVVKLTDMMEKAASKLNLEKGTLRENFDAFAGGLEDVTRRTDPFKGQSQDVLVYLFAKEGISLDSLIQKYRELNIVKEDFQKSLMKGSTDTDDERFGKFKAAQKKLEEVIQLQLTLRNKAKSANEQRLFDLPVFTETTTGTGAAKKSAQQVLEEVQRLGARGLTSDGSVKAQQLVIDSFVTERDKAVAELVKTKDELGDLFKNKLPETFKAATEAIKQAADPMKAIQDSLRDSLKGMREEADRLINKLKDIAPIAPAPVGNALGGLMMGGGGFGGAFAGGGMIDGPLGRDNLFIRAHAGEFVVNAEAAQKFYPQLTAMNSMYTAAPAYNNGGPITQVGDIHINTTLTGQTDIDVISIGKQLRREIKRGTVRLS